MVLKSNTSPEFPGISILVDFVKPLSHLFTEASYPVIPLSHFFQLPHLNEAQAHITGYSELRDPIVICFRFGQEGKCLVGP